MMYMRRINDYDYHQTLLQIFGLQAFYFAPEAIEIKDDFSKTKKGPFEICQKND